MGLLTIKLVQAAGGSMVTAGSGREPSGDTQSGAEDGRLSS
jgi:hypothetical protein